MPLHRIATAGWGRSGKARVPGQTWGLVLGLLALAGTVAIGGCVAPSLEHQTRLAYVTPPREELERSLAQDRIRGSDVLTVKLPGENTASLIQTYEVAPDGTIELTGYGKVQVAGKTMEEARQAIYEAMAATSELKQAVEVARNEYYLVTVAADGTRQLFRMPLKQTVHVKEAVAGVPNLSRKVIWIARPSANGAKDVILPVDWEAIVQGYDESTNHELKAGDFLFVAHEPAEGLGRVFSAVSGMIPKPAQRPAQGTPKPATRDAANLQPTRQPLAQSK